MNNRGFNEKELRKTIVTKIDKDGFNKREVFDGDVGSSDFTFATMTIDNESNPVPMYLCAHMDEEYTYLPGELMVFNGTFESGVSFRIPLYKGFAVFQIPFGVVLSGLSVSGDAEIDTDNHVLKIYGDFTIAYTGK